MDLVALGVVVALGVAHLAAPLLAFIELVPRSRALSAAGGVSVAYVFVHLLPEVAETQAAVDEHASGVVAGFERHAYVAALLGLGVYYGLERAAVTSHEQRRERGEATDEEPTSPGAFWLSTASFAVYNAIIGYLIVRRAEEDGAVELVLFAAALGLHFLVNDLGLEHRHRRRYERYGRPILVAALAVGWAVGVTTELSEPAVGLVVAFLAGGIVLNVIKEELPEERRSRFVPLALGATLYAALVLAVA